MGILKKSTKPKKGGIMSRKTAGKKLEGKPVEPVVEAPAKKKTKAPVAKPQKAKSATVRVRELLLDNIEASADEVLAILKKEGYPVMNPSNVSIERSTARSYISILKERGVAI
jgi:hypothetical protein